MTGKTTTEGGSEWRRVRLWFNGQAIADSIVETARASQLQAFYYHRFSSQRLRVTVEPAQVPEQ